MSFHHGIKRHPSPAALVQGHCHKTATRWGKKSLDFLPIKTSAQLGLFGTGSLVSGCIRAHSENPKQTKCQLSTTWISTSPNRPVWHRWIVRSILQSVAGRCFAMWLGNPHFISGWKKKTQCLPLRQGCRKTKLNPSNTDSRLITSWHINSHENFSCTILRSLKVCRNLGESRLKADLAKHAWLNLWIVTLVCLNYCMKKNL